jgi:hypothetical protein
MPSFVNPIPPAERFVPKAPGERLPSARGAGVGEAITRQPWNVQPPIESLVAAASLELARGPSAVAVDIASASEVDGAASGCLEGLGDERAEHTATDGADYMDVVDVVDEADHEGHEGTVLLEPEESGSHDKEDGNGDGIASGGIGGTGTQETLIDTPIPELETIDGNEGKYLHADDSQGWSEYPGSLPELRWPPDFTSPSVGLCAESEQKEDSQRKPARSPTLKQKKQHDGTGSTSCSSGNGQVVCSIRGGASSSNNSGGEGEHKKRPAPY